MRKLAIVTGGSGSIGQAIIQHFKTKGIDSVSWDIRANSTNDTPSIQCDVSNEDSVNTAFEATLQKYGAPTILINNCGIQHLAPIEEFPLEKWNQLLGVMLTGTFLCSKAIIPTLKKNQWGRIVNISSIHGKVASPYKSAYVAAKHGVIGFSKVMAVELAEANVTVNSICPGFVDTPLMREQISKQAELNQMSEDQVISEIMLKPANIKKFSTSEQVAGLTGFLISDFASTITGEAYSMSGGWGMGH